MNNNDETARRTAAFAVRREQAANLEKFDYDGARECLVGCRDDDLTDAQTTMVALIAAGTTSIDPKVINKLNLEVLREHPVYGILANVTKATDAVHGEATLRFGSLLHSEESFWAYQRHEDSDEYGIWGEISDDKIDGLQIEALPAEVSAKSSFRREVTKRLASRVRTPDAFAHPKPGMAVMNGLVGFDENTGLAELQPHSPDHRARNKIAANYVPEAQAPNFIRLLLRAFGGDPIRMTVFLEWLACAIFQRMPSEDSVRTCLVLYGSQRTGKSTLIEFAKTFFMDSQIASLSPDLLGKPERNAHLAGKALNAVAELSPRKPLRCDVLKQVLSHEPLSGRRLFENLFTFTPRCAHLWACNELPKLDETHPSLMRRFVVISMGNTLSDAEAAENFGSTIEQEAEGVIATIVRSFCDVMKRGRFILPDDSDLLVSRMQFGDDLASTFARFRLAAAPGARATTEELKRELRLFAMSLEMEPDEAVHDGTMKKLSGLMRSMFRAERRVSNGRPFYEGVRLIPQSCSSEGDEADLSEL